MASTIAIENARIGFRNFSGRPGRYNKAGDRDFTVFFDNAQAQELADDGWNIHWIEPRDPEEAPAGRLRVAVNYDHMPPKILLITSTTKMLLTEDDISVLDTADIRNVDLVIRPYNWSVNGNRGVKAYLKSMYVTIEEDEFAAKYDDIPTV